MADKKISQMTLLSSTDLVASTDYLPIVDPSEPAAADQNKRIYVQSIIDNAVTNAQLVSPAQLNPMARAVSVSMTAAASGSNGITVADDDDIDFGTGDFFIHWEGSLPDWTPSAAQILARKGDNTVTPGYVFYVASGGNIGLIIRNGTTTRTSVSTVVNTLADSRSAKITAVLTAPTASAGGSAVFYVNGVQIGASVAIASGLINVTTATALYVSGESTARTASNTVSCIVGNFAPTASEVLDLCTNGIPASWEWGSQTAFYTSNFSAGTNGWTASALSSLVGNIDGIGGQDNWLCGTLNATNTAHAMLISNLVIGNKYSITGLCYIPSSNAGAVAISVRDGASVALTSVTALDAATAFSTGTFTATTDSLRLYAMNSVGSTTVSGGGDVMYVKDVLITRLGATMALLPQDIQYDTGQWFDASSNTGGGMMPATGATVQNKALSDARQVRWTNTWAGTQELQYIGGVNQGILPAKAYIESIVGIVSGATVEDIIVGDGSDTDRYVTITTGLAAGTVTFTLANRTTDGTNLKLTVDPDANATMSITWTITYRILQ